MAIYPSPNHSYVTIFPYSLSKANSMGFDFLFMSYIKIVLLFWIVLIALYSLLFSLVFCLAHFKSFGSYFNRLFCNKASPFVVVTLIVFFLSPVTRFPWSFQSAETI